MLLIFFLIKILLSFAKKIMKKIIIANQREMYAPLDEKYLEHRREVWREIGFDVCEVSGFWYGDNKTVILPHVPSRWFREHLQSTMGYGNVSFVSPSITTDSICKDILSDKDAMRAFDKCEISVYGATPEMYGLADALSKTNSEAHWIDVPDAKDYWTTTYFDSKIGFRNLYFELYEQIKHTKVKIPSAFICDSLIEARKILAYLKNTCKNCVIKGSRGVAGFENLFFKWDSNDDYSHRIEDLSNWETSTYLVEELVECDWNMPFSFPSIDTFIEVDGSLHQRDISAMYVEPPGVYKGVVVGGVELTRYAGQIMDFNLVIGHALSAFGYRGNYDIDFIISKNGELFVNEINLRKTGGTHVLDIKDQLKLFGKSLMFLRYSNPKLCDIGLNSFYKCCDKWRFNHDKEKGLIFVMTRGLENGRGSIGFISVADTPSQANELGKQFINELLYL